MSENVTLRERAARYLGDAARGVRQAPVEVAATLTVTIAFSYALEAGSDAMAAWTEIAVACLLIAAVAWTGTLLHAMGAWSATRRWVVSLAGALVLAAYALFIADFDYVAERWRAVLLVAAAVSWLVAVPAFAGPRQNAVERMRRIDGRILLRVIGAGLYGIALFAGLALALRAIDVLFELDLRSEIYGHVWGWISFALVPWVVLGGLRDYVRPIDQGSAVAGVAQRIALFLVPPLLAVYYVILYAYVARIFLTQEIPKNLVSPLVLAAGGLAALGLLLFDPRPAARGVGRWLRIAPALFLPLAPLGAWALLLRTGQYGLTEFRLIRLIAIVVLALLGVAATIQLVRRRPFTLHAAPLALAVAALLFAVGPWSVLALSKASQRDRLLDALAALDIPADDAGWQSAAPDSAPRIVDAGVYDQIRGSARYLATHHGADALPPVLERYARNYDSRWRDYAADLRLQPDRDIVTGSVIRFAAMPMTEAFPVRAGTAWRIGWSPVPEGPYDAPSDAATSVRIVPLDSVRLVMHADGRRVQADLGRLIATIPPEPARRPDSEMLRVQDALVPLTDTTGVEHGQLLVWHLMVQSDSTGTRIGRLEGLLVLYDSTGATPRNE